MLVADKCFFKLHEYPIRCKIKLVVCSKTLVATSDGHGYPYHATEIYGTEQCRWRKPK